MKKSSIALIRGKVVTLDPNEAIYQSILIEDGIISALESSQVVMRLAQEKGIPTVDLNGQTVIPGPIDTHFHLFQTGLDLSSIDFNPCRSIDEMLQLLRENIRVGESQGWILGKGLDEFKIKEKRPPTAQELDVVTKRIPVFIEDRGIHYCQLNTLAFHRLGIPSDTPGVRKHADGKTVTGQLMEEIVGEARHRLLKEIDEEHKRQFILEGARYAASCGITAIHAMEGGELFGDGEIPLLLEMQEDLPIRMSLHWNTFNLEAVRQARLRVLGGDIWLDGALGSHTAALKSPYADDPKSVGRLYHTLQRIEAFVRECIAGGVQVGFHAIGDRAIEQALAAFETVLGEGHAPERGLRIDHFGLPGPEQVKKAADLGIVISTQPTFPYLRGGPGSVYESRLDQKRECRAYPFRELLDAGLLVAGGSDSDVLPAEIMLGLHGAVNHPHERQRLTVDEAIRLYTVNAARIGFEEDTKGTLAVGKVGDLIVLDRSPCDAETKEIRDISIMMTVVNGVAVYNGRAERKGEG